MADDCDGLLIIDKPAGITSRAAVDRAQRWFPRNTRIGHTGTLDPLATGVLVLCVGLATRLAEYVQRMTKVYRAGVALGSTSDSDDADGAITPGSSVNLPSRAEVEQALAGFVGVIDQVPPAYSAAKVTGRRAYNLARQGRTVELAPRRVSIHAINVLAYDNGRLEMEIRCGKGTYIRSLARDLGQQLGCGGYIASLRRLEVGCFHATDACPLDVAAEAARRHLLPLSLAVRDLPALTLPDADASRLLHGGQVSAPDGWDAQAGEAALFDAAGRLLAVVEIARGKLRPGKVLAEPNARGAAGAKRSEPLS